VLTGRAEAKQARGGLMPMLSRLLKRAG
jgi:hypothetical protein